MLPWGCRVPENTLKTTLRPVSDPEVSVLLPVRNGERFIEESVRSVLSQTLKNFELLVVDDGSQDRTIELLESFGDPRLTIIKNTGQPGLVGALNTGISFAEGDFIARIDHDDIALPTRLEVQANILRRKRNVGLVGSWVETFGASTKLVKLPETSHHIRWSLFSENPMAHPSVMFRTNWNHGRKGYYDERFSLAEDYEMWTRLLAQWDGINIPVPLTQYRIHEDQLTGQLQQEREQCVREIARREADKVGYPALPKDSSFLQECLWWKHLLNCPGVAGKGDSASRRSFLRIKYLTVLKAQLSKCVEPKKWRGTGEERPE